MNKFIAEIRPDLPFCYKATLYAHGWADLEPFHFNPDPQILDYSFLVSKQKSVRVRIGNINNTGIRLSCNENLSRQEKERIIQIVRHIFRLDEDFSEFYRIAKKEPSLRWIVEQKAGRLLRAGSLWEDLVKTLCTTNCSWYLTKIMVRNLVQKIGEGNHFPEPREILEFDESYLRDEIKMGYRAPYLLEMALNIKNGTIDLKKWINWSGSTESLFKEIINIKGFGEYAVSSFLKLLGRYDYLGIDSWGRRSFANRYNNGEFIEDKQIKDKYKIYGKWSGLFYWLDLTEHIYK
jgi:3-methyladenine DNA glycosylase/8-oxoguanine DNA glycosylase